MCLEKATGWSEPQEVQLTDNLLELTKHHSELVPWTEHVRKQCFGVPGSADRRTYYSGRRPRFSAWHSHQVPHNNLIPVPGGSMHIYTHMLSMNSHRCEHIHVKVICSKKERRKCITIWGNILSLVLNTSKGPSCITERFYLLQSKL